MIIFKRRNRFKRKKKKYLITIQYLTLNIEKNLRRHMGSLITIRGEKNRRDGVRFTYTFCLYIYIYLHKRWAHPRELGTIRQGEPHPPSNSFVEVSLPITHSWCVHICYRDVLTFSYTQVTPMGFRRDRFSSWALTHIFTHIDICIYVYLCIPEALGIM